jgi:hypothetical protein
MDATGVPPAIGAYFAASERNETEALLSCFAADAVVVDEDQTWRGATEIRVWRETVATKFE